MQYFYSPKNQGFFIDAANSNIPTDVIELTQEQYSEFFEKQATGKYTGVFDCKTKKFIYTEINRDFEDIAKQQRIIEAKSLLAATDWRMLADKFKSYAPEKQAAIIEYREQLREVVRGNRNTLPVLNN